VILKELMRLSLNFCRACKLKVWTLGGFLKIVHKQPKVHVPMYDDAIGLVFHLVNVSHDCIMYFKLFGFTQPYSRGSGRPV
jgi:hypothetical protein